MIKATTLKIKRISAKIKRILNDSVNAGIIMIGVFLYMGYRVLLLLIIPILFGLMFDRALSVIFKKDIPFVADMVAGTVLNGITIAAWIVSYFW